MDDADRGPGEPGGRAAGEADRGAVRMDVEADGRVLRDLSVQADTEGLSRRQQSGREVLIAAGAAFETQPQTALEQLLLGAGAQLQIRVARAGELTVGRHAGDAEQLRLRARG